MIPPRPPLSVGLALSCRMMPPCAPFWPALSWRMMPPRAPLSDGLLGVTAGVAGLLAAGVVALAFLSAGLSAAMTGIEARRAPATAAASRILVFMANLLPVHGDPASLVPG